MSKRPSRADGRGCAWSPRVLRDQGRALAALRAGNARKASNASTSADLCPVSLDLLSRPSRAVAGKDKWTHKACLGFFSSLLEIEFLPVVPETLNPCELDGDVGGAERSIPLQPSRLIGPSGAHSKKAGSAMPLPLCFRSYGLISPLSLEGKLLQRW